MKQFILTIFFTVVSCVTLSAQSYMIVNSEKVFKSIAEYNTSLESLDLLAQDYQKQVDTKFTAVENLYNDYMSKRESLSSSVRSMYEAKILEVETEATKFQKSIFDTDGILMKKRVELIQPIQKRVFAAIKAYATASGVEMVIDSASNATLLYNSDKVSIPRRLLII